MSRNRCYARTARALTVRPHRLFAGLAATSTTGACAAGLHDYTILAANDGVLVDTGDDARCELSTVAVFGGCGRAQGRPIGGRERPVCVPLVRPDARGDRSARQIRLAQDRADAPPASKLLDERGVRWRDPAPAGPIRVQVRTAQRLAEARPQRARRPPFPCRTMRGLFPAGAPANNACDGTGRVSRAGRAPRIRGRA